MVARRLKHMIHIESARLQTVCLICFCLELGYKEIQMDLLSFTIVDVTRRITLFTFHFGLTISLLLSQRSVVTLFYCKITHPKLSKNVYVYCNIPSCLLLQFYEKNATKNTLHFRKPAARFCWAVGFKNIVWLMYRKATGHLNCTYLPGILWQKVLLEHDYQESGICLLCSFLQK